MKKVDYESLMYGPKKRIGNFLPAELWDLFRKKCKREGRMKWRLLARLIIMYLEESERVFDKRSRATGRGKNLPHGAAVDRPAGSPKG
jgi:hypothetical protein